jgi:hypothetical protein
MSDSLLKRFHVPGAWALAAIILPLAALGCGHPGEGSVQVSPEARRRLVPHVADQPKSRSLKAVAGKALGIKERAAAPTSQ